MINAYYPSSTHDIIHKGKNGNIYRLDGIDKSFSLKNELKKLEYFNIMDIKSTSEVDINEGIRLINNVHNPEIISSYKLGTPEVLANSSGLMWQPKLFNYAIEQALVSNRVIENTVKNNISLAITGGGHHAEKDTPFGFCPINTMAISAMQAKNLGKKVAIIDLDTHYSNGCFDILENVEGISVFSIWNQRLEKWKYFDNVGNIWHKKVKDKDEYISALEILVKELIKLKPEIVIYHLGLDVLDSDRMGGVQNFDENAILERENLIFNLFKNILNTKVAIFIGGAYIDHSKGESYAIQQRNYLTKLQVRILEKYKR